MIVWHWQTASLIHAWGRGIVFSIHRYWYKGYVICVGRKKLSLLENDLPRENLNWLKHFCRLTANGDNFQRYDNQRNNRGGEWFIFDITRQKTRIHTPYTIYEITVIYSVRIPQNRAHTDISDKIYLLSTGLRPSFWKTSRGESLS